MPNAVETNVAFQGWSLRQATERAIGAFRGAVEHGAASLLSRHDATERLRRIMSDVRFVAFESSSQPSAPLRPIHAEAWKDLQIIDLDESVVQKINGRQSKLCNVVVFPLVHSPDAPSRLQGLSLVEAFRRCIFDDPEIDLLANRAFAKKKSDLESLRDGQFPTLGTDYKWPLDLIERELAHNIVGDWYVMVPGPPRPIPSNDDRILARTIVDRVSALRRHLIAGRVIAEGMFVNSGITQQIPPPQWARGELSVDVHNGDLLEYEHQKWVPRWSGIMLLGGSEFHVKPTKPAGARRYTIGNSRGGSRPKTTPLGSSISRAIAELWPDGIPKEVPVQSRYQRIIAWQKANEVAVASPKSIYRYLKSSHSR
jgi:hypothetical protein